MRAIEFRAWDNENKEMIYTPSLWTDDFARDINQYFKYWQEIVSENERMIFMQYTNRKDKHGKKIYEKDIVRFKLLTGDGEKEGIGIVEWNDIECAWVVRVIKSNNGIPIWGYYLLGFIKELEVIGNVYENPELE